jgi:hypothetical protein
MAPPATAAHTKPPCRPAADPSADAVQHRPRPRLGISRGQSGPSQWTHLCWPSMDEGPPSSYLLLAKDTPVFGSDGGVTGKVKEVLCDPGDDIFDGLVLATSLGERYLQADQVTAIHERGVDVAISAAQAVQLPAPVPHRCVKYDAVADERPWAEVMRWLHDHLAHLIHPGDSRLDGARERLAQREKALRLAREDPQLALEAGVGRPDLPGAYDGGLVDVNHAPVGSLLVFPPSTRSWLVGLSRRVSGSVASPHSRNSEPCSTCLATRLRTCATTSSSCPIEEPPIGHARRLLVRDLRRPSPDLDLLAVRGQSPDARDRWRR